MVKEGAGPLDRNARYERRDERPKSHGRREQSPVSARLTTESTTTFGKPLSVAGQGRFRTTAKVAVRETRVFGRFARSPAAPTSGGSESTTQVVLGEMSRRGVVCHLWNDPSLDASRFVRLYRLMIRPLVALSRKRTTTPGNAEGGPNLRAGTSDDAQAPSRLHVCLQTRAKIRCSRVCSRVVRVAEVDERRRTPRHAGR